MDAEGNFIAQICHIEAAEEGGERFNEDQDNEKRRAFGNLMLLCYPHHVITNNVEHYSVADMQEMKRRHEAKFADIVSKIRASIQDHTNESQLSFPATLAKMNHVLGWNQGADDLLETIPLIVEFAEKVKMLPVPTRELLAIAITRGTAFGGERRHLEVPAGELLHACDLAPDQLREQIVILKNRNVAWIDSDFEYDHDEVLYIGESLAGWSFAEDLQSFCKIANVSIQQIIVDLRFDLLD